MAKYTKILRTKAMNKLGSDKKVQQQAFKLSQERFNRKKAELLRDFRSHPVTEEIQEGPSASNKSGTIIGGGNLFSFIGFDNAANPIRPVLFLLDQISLNKTRPRVTKSKNRVYLGYKVNIPTNEELAAVSKMPWEPGSWLFKIEKGMSGLGYYLYQRKNIRASRSGTGIQVDGKIRQGMFKRTSYISGLLAKFRRGFSQ